MGKLGILLILMVAWIGLAAGAMLTGQFKTAIVPAPVSLLDALPAHVALIDQRGPLLVLRSDSASFVSDLYAAGAPLVLPFRKKTCLDLQAL